MSYKRLVQVALVGLIGSLYTGCSVPAGFLPDNSTASEGQAIVLTDVDFDPESLLPETQPLADYLGSKLERTGITKGEVKIASSIDEVSQWMSSGEVNLYFDSVYPAMKVIKASGAQPILRRWKEGVSEYNTSFVVLASSDIESIEDLQGQVIAMQDPSSSSGFMFPMDAILAKGLAPVEMQEANHSVEADKIGYIFSGKDENTIRWLLEEKVAAGAVDNETLAALTEEELAQIMVIDETETFPRHIVVVGASLDERQIKALKKVMIDMDQSKQGREALEEFSGTAQFDEFPKGPEDAFDRLSAAYDRIEEFLAQQEANSNLE